MPSYKINSWYGIRLAEIYKVHTTNPIPARELPRDIRYRLLADAGMLERTITKRKVSWTITPFAVGLLKHRKLI